MELPDTWACKGVAFDIMSVSHDPRKKNRNYLDIRGKNVMLLLEEAYKGSYYPMWGFYLKDIWYLLPMKKEHAKRSVISINDSIEATKENLTIFAMGFYDTNADQRKELMTEGDWIGSFEVIQSKDSRGLDVILNFIPSDQGESEGKKSERLNVNIEDLKAKMNFKNEFNKL